MDIARRIGCRRGVGDRVVALRVVHGELREVQRDVRVAGGCGRHDALAVLDRVGGRARSRDQRRDREADSEGHDERSGLADGIQVCRSGRHAGSNTMNIAGDWPMKLRIVGVACALLVANAACGSDSPDVNKQRPTDPAPAETPGTLGPTTTLTGTSTPT